MLGLIKQKNAYVIYEWPQREIAQHRAEVKELRKKWNLDKGTKINFEHPFNIGLNQGKLVIQTIFLFIFP